MADNKLQPIIIKRIKKGKHAAHGGAWKIAYADFVTAMMAFFLLMWLLGSTAQGELQGIAEYFNAPLQVAMAGGNDLSKVHGQVRRSNSNEETPKRMNPNTARAEMARQDAARLKALRGKIDALITQNPRLNEYRSQIRLEVTPDGLQIQIVDDQSRPMFDSGSALVKPYMRDILQEIGAALTAVENNLSLAGHTDAVPYGNGERGYSNWELSADRANASRRELVSAGMPDAKLRRVVGLAASDLLEPDEPRAPSNRRITITVLTREAEERLLGKAPRAVPMEDLPAALDAANAAPSAPLQAARGAPQKRDNAAASEQKQP